jgi:polyhydroxyalkanoate synthesis regulator phasin
VDEIRAVIQESWSKALLAAESVEEHAHALVSGLGSIGQKAALAPEQAKKLAAELAERMQTHRKVLTGEVERAVKTAVDHLRLPARADLSAMSEKLAALEARLGELERGARTTERKESK